MIIFVDSDDIIHKDLIMLCVKTFCSNNTDLVIYSYKKIIDSDNILMKDININNVNLVNLNKDELFLEVFQRGNKCKQKFRMFFWNKMYKKSYLTDIRYPMDRNYGEDTIFTYDVIKNTTSAIFLEDIYLYYYRDNQDSLLNRKLSYNNVKILSSYNYIYNDIKKNYKEFTDLVIYAFIIRIFELFNRIISECKHYSKRVTYYNYINKEINILVKE